jgi:hypothetical protein
MWWATRHDRVLALQAGVGDLVTAGQPVITIYSRDARAARSYAI